MARELAGLNIKNLPDNKLAETKESLQQAIKDLRREAEREEAEKDKKKEDEKKRLQLQKTNEEIAKIE